MYKIYIKSIPVIIIILGFLFSCTKDDVDVYGSDCNCDKNCNDDNSNNGKTTFFVNFEPYILSEAIVKSIGIEPISPGRYLTFFAYSDDKLIQEVNYKSESSGTVESLSGTPMILTGGSYTFYGAGSNETQDVTPTFTNNIATNIKNGIDYLSWVKSTPSVINSERDLMVKMNHACTQIVFKLDSIGTNSNNETIKIKLLSLYCSSSSLDGVSWNLLTGSISSTNSFSGEAEMGITGNYAQYIMRPIENVSRITFKMTVSFNGEEQEPYVFEGVIDGNAFNAATAYFYHVSFANEIITFYPVSVINWLEVSGGKPVIPIQL